ncbi:uncharacterized protein LOC128241045 [Mya arenaria]|uniref:uncharacterized protein LOC128241045 n=1 Tax=Mya arenaria TaxID=6604 RepID=UPI0022E4A8F5|nr:uncharacterized protein LOC128241045 [Mya arenaria]
MKGITFVSLMLVNCKVCDRLVKQVSSWQVLNSYAKLLAREATDSSEPSAKRMFVIPSYTAVLWDAGMYDRYMYTKVDFTQFDFVVVPWNKNGNHWVVIVARPKDLTVAVHGSLGADNRPLIDRFCNFMSERLKIVNDGLQHWEPVSSTTNQQTDGSSCGLFVLMLPQLLVDKEQTQHIRRNAAIVMGPIVKGMPENINILVEKRW